MSQVRGLPLLSGPPPHMESGDACRKCNKEFNMFINRSRKCNHCGYLYCGNCSDYQALMPRSGQESGYDPMPVCAFCIDYLNITAAGKGMLRTMQLAKLKKYLEVYNLDSGRAVEKDDLIEAILRARRHNGCLSPEKEDYYRNYSVPDKSSSHTRSRFFGRSAGQSSNRSPAPPPPPPPNNTRPYNFPRPDLEPNPSHQQRPFPPQTHPSHPPPPSVPPRPTPPRSVPPRPVPPQSVPPRPQTQPPQQQYHHQHHHPPSPQPPPPPPPQASRPTGYSQYQRPSTHRSSENLRPGQPQPRQRAASAVPSPPTLDQLLDMNDGSIKSLSIGALKSILFTNHVNAGQILEKGDLVAKVKALVEDERRDRERQRALQEAEEQEAIERQRAMLEEHRRAQVEMEQRARAEEQAWAQTGAPGWGFATGEDAAENAETEGSPKRSTSPPAPAPSPKTPPKTRGTAADLERTGLCVICQDDGANIAIVDCGYVFVLNLVRALLIILLVTLRCAEDALN
ncbi:hypothetical protein C0995_003593 [Termitomyces sp. Mi166|nr:hypothetical protein C0995_003593 [Termitomyces sp. Mi166\